MNLKNLMVFIVSVTAVSATVTNKSLEKLKQSFFVSNPVSFDYKLIGKNDEHRYGVELKENKQFHHTTTG